jgi:methionyl-tRNA synthetase
MTKERNFELDFDTYWDSDSAEMYEVGEVLAEALMATGKHTKKEVEKMISEFQKNAFRDGMLDEAYNNCGDDA